MGTILTDQGDIEAPARALIIVAHPDDIDFGMAGTVAALREHRSQTEHMEDLDGRLREWSSETARAGGLADGRLAEAYRVVPAG